MEAMGQEKSSQHQVVQFICPLTTCTSVFDHFSQLIHHLDGSACGEWVWNSEQQQLDLLKKYIKWVLPMANVIKSHRKRFGWFWEMRNSQAERIGEMLMVCMEFGAEEGSGLEVLRTAHSGLCYIWWR
jgi:hypothetical protein